jgi:hypothetical protein
MKKGFALTLMTVAIALVQVSTVQATAPTVNDPGDVIVGDFETGSTPATGSCIFVFPDAFNLADIVNDETPDGQIKWSYLESTGTYSINGAPSLAANLAGLNDSDPTSPSASRRIDLVNSDAAEPGDPEDGNAQTVTFRNINLTPTNTPFNPGALGILPSETRTLTLFASDCSTFTSRSIMVFTGKSTSDTLSGSGKEFVRNENFRVTGAGDWIGTAPNQFGNGSTSVGASGLCLTVPLAGGGSVIWFSGPNVEGGYHQLVDNTVYCVRLTMTSTAAAGAVPFFDLPIDNFFQSGQGNNYGQFAWLHDGPGGATAIPAAETNYYFIWAPNPIAAAQWSSIMFTAATDDENDPRYQLRTIDANAALQADSRAGTICVAEMEIRSIIRDNIAFNTVYNAPLAEATHFATRNGADQTAAIIDDGTGTATVTLTTAGNQDVTVGIFDQAQPTLATQLYPVVWNANTTYRVRSRIRAAAAGTNRPDLVNMLMSVNSIESNELGVETFATRGAGDSAGAASPTTTAATYEAYLHGQFGTAAGGEANRLAGSTRIFNTDALFGAGTGSDTVIIESLELDEITTPLAGF